MKIKPRRAQSRHKGHNFYLFYTGFNSGAICHVFQKRIPDTTFFVAAILVVTVVSSLPLIHNQSFVWDDEGYITNNPLVLSFDLKKIFTANVMGNYHPVTVLILALEYLVFSMYANGYHIFHLFLHLINVLLVYLAVQKLSGKKEVALVTALLFGIHPLHVESVAWLSRLKDLLYTGLFFGFLDYLPEIPG